MMLLKLSWRSLWRNRRRTLITVGSIVLGTSLALFVISLGAGMYKKLVDDAVRMNAGHITVEHRDYAAAPSIDLYVDGVSRVVAAASAIDGVVEVKPLVVGQAVVATGRGSAGVAMLGVDPAAEREVSPLARRIVAGRYLEPDDERGVVIGAQLAERLRLAPGKKLVVTTNDVHGELVNELLRVTGIFELGMEETDGFLIQVPIRVARRIVHLGEDQATQVGVILRAPEYQTRVLKRLRAALAGEEDMVVLPWQDVLTDLAGFMAVDMGSNYILQAIFLGIIAFTILNTILMSVLERTREFAVLLALGTAPRRLQAQVILESLLIGLLGTGLGLLLGGGVSYYFQLHGIDFSKIYSEGATITGFAIDPLVRNYVSLRLLAWLGAGMLGMTVLIGCYPAYRATRIVIPDVLRAH